MIKKKSLFNLLPIFYVFDKKVNLMNTIILYMVEKEIMEKKRCIYEKRQSHIHTRFITTNFTRLQ